MATPSKRKTLAERIPRALGMLESCSLCPRNCRVNRIKGETGACGIPNRAKVYGYMPHFGEEPPLSGHGGSGTMFFSGCSLGCCFCQNYEISIQQQGDWVDPGQIATAMVRLRGRGCHNINFVTPTHVVPFILQAVDQALDMGMDLPLVYNSSGYECPETLALLEGIMDIYLPDFKFWDPELARAACSAPDYPEVARQAVKIMQQQVGDLTVNSQGIAMSGLLVRHLVMPGTLKDTKEILFYLKESVSSHIHINLMSQYRPLWQADKVPEFSNHLDPKEFRAAVTAAKKLGIDLVR